eukprot:CAMPEP_0119314526 /NCGR_PEP_ID=MMETSP1333-20130426/33045_1 /TAXON_ID=418940 /ORGANISM="Scyphosphaera apsteinii, Strain RCC1455" /LENGTH=286 /DNA_ID=CAMNT_0007319651 /DNA_START=81 /DNA_END=938 /DNA_ORIENTATION=+
MVLFAVEKKVEAEILREVKHYDQMLSDKGYAAILRTVSDELFDRMQDEMRLKMSDADQQYIELRVCQMVWKLLTPPVQARFQKLERVVCRIGGEHGWAPGTIQALNEDDPQDPSGQTTLPYVVKLDAPLNRLISVPYDEGSLCRAEVCFGQPVNTKRDPCVPLGFTLLCKPQRQQSRKARFVVGERVACAVEDESGDYTVWAAGKVSDVDYNVERDVMMQDRELGLSWDWRKRSGVVPYRVLLDSGVSVFVHRDEHWLVRDLALQPPGPRQSADGTRDLKRLIKRR